MALTPLDKLDQLLWPAGKPPVGVPGKESHGGTSRLAVASADLTGLAPGRPCEAVKDALDAVLKTLAESSRHEAARAGTVNMLRIGSHGHRGVPDALAGIRTSFVDAVKDRAGSKDKADEEWKRLADGAAALVLKDWKPLPWGICRCEVAELRRLVERNALISNGRAGNNERKVLRRLLDRAGINRSRLLSDSQRQIAAAIDIHQQTVSKTLLRLEGGGWLVRQTTARGSSKPGRLLLATAASVTELSTPRPAGRGGAFFGERSLSPADQLVDNSVPGAVHRLFGAGGLGPGPAETFAALPERRHRISRGYLLTVAPGSLMSRRLWDPYRGQRQIPRHSPAPAGVTVKMLSEQLTKSPETVRRHLKKLQKAGMAFKADRRWYRYRFDPEELAERLQVRDTAELKRQKYIQERRAFYNSQCRPGPDGMSRLTLTAGGVYVATATGEVAWEDPDAFP